MLISKTIGIYGRHSPSQFAPTILVLKLKHESVCDPEKKSGPKNGLQKAGYKKQSHTY